MKWKQQHEALFEPAKFQTTNHANAFSNKRRTLPLPVIPESTKFQLDFHEVPASRLDTQQQHQQYDNKFNKILRRDVNKTEFENMMTFSQLNRIARSEAMKVAVTPYERLKSDRKEDFQTNPCGCHYENPNHHQQASHSLNSDDHQQIQNNEFENNEDVQSDQRLVKSSKEIEKKLKGQLTNDILVNIVEEQIEIVKQQKQILMQQHEIFTLQYQIEKLLLVNGNIDNKSPTKQQQIHSICERRISSPRTSPGVQLNGLPIQDRVSQPINNANTSPKARKSIGVMTSFRGNLNEIYSPKENHNQRLASGKDSNKDTMLERINKIIKNSPPMINYKMNNDSMNCRISPNRADVNISSRT